jgi:hypothetical protein
VLPLMPPSWLASDRAKHIMQQRGRDGLDRAVIYRRRNGGVMLSRGGSDGYGLEPAEIRMAVNWLKINAPDEAVPLPAVLGKHGGDRRSEQARDRVRIANLKSSDTKEYVLARLDRDRPDHRASGSRCGACPLPQVYRGKLRLTQTE